MTQVRWDIRWQVRCRCQLCKAVILEVAELGPENLPAIANAMRDHEREHHPVPAKASKPK
jgi:hypothetical protein